MASSDYIRASNGSGEAVRAIVTEVREPGDMSIVADSVLNFPNNFIATVATLNEETGYIDPETMTIFKGYLDGSIIMIEEFSPGYSDIGNEEGQVVLLKPTTPWADEVADRLDEITLEEISEAEIDAGTSATKRAITGRRVNYIIDYIQNLVFLWTHPVNSIYMTIDSANPSVAHGGTWVAWGSGRVPVGVDAGQTEFDTVEETGGAKNVTLTAPQMPIHGFYFSHHGDENGSVVRGAGATNGAYTGGTHSQYKAPPGTSSGAGSNRQMSWSFGGDQAHPNLQPYITCYMWKRTA